MQQVTIPNTSITTTSITASIDLELVESIPVALLVADPAGRVLAASRALRELLDLADDPIGRPARFLSRQPGWQQCWKLGEEGITEPRLVGLECDGTDQRRYFELTASRSAAGTVLSLVDVTALRAMHQQLRAASKLLADARSEVLASRDDLRRAEAQIADLVGELESAAAGGE